jgi:hypothetical protein
MALSPNHFGFGLSKSEAKRNLLKFGGDRKRSGLYEVPMKYWLDDFGNAHGDGEAKFVGGTDWRVTSFSEQGRRNKAA